MRILNEQALNNMRETLPPHMHGAIERYFEDRLPPGSFLTSVLTNDLGLAVGFADDINERYLPKYVRWLYNYAPSVAWGNTEKVKEWLQGGT